MRWVRGTVRTLLWTATALVVVAVGGVLVLTRTGPGVRFVVERGLEALEGSIQGTIRVEAVESADLLDGALLRGVEIRDASGRDFARVDSLRVEYAIPALLAGDVILNRVDARGLSVVLERLPGQEDINVTRIFASAASPVADTAASQERPGPGGRILLRNVTLSRSAVRLELPVEDPGSLPEGAFTHPAPKGDDLMRRYSVRELDAEMPRIAVSMPGQEGERIRVARLSGVLEIQNRAVKLVELQGEARRTEGRLAFAARRLELATSRAGGSVTVDWSSEDVVVSADLEAEPVALADLRWLVPELPDGRVTGPVSFRIGGGSTEWRADGAELTLGESKVRATGGVRTAPELAFGDLALELAPLSLPRLDPYLGGSAPLRGSVDGNLQLDGTLEGLAVGGRLTLREAGVRPVSARVAGVLGLGERLGARRFRLDVEPLDYGLVERLWPAYRVEGTGSLNVEADGWLDEGTRLSVDLEHEAAGLSRSRVEADGTLRADSADVHVELDGEVDPLDLRALRAVSPELNLGGEIEGPVRVTGRLGDLRVETELEVAEGRLAVDARFDARDPAAGYRLDGRLESFRLSELFGSLPAPTTLSGSVSARGRGLDRESLEAEGSVRLRDTRVGRFTVDSAVTEVAVRGGELRIDTLEARTNVARLTGSGRLGLRADGREGELRLAFRNDSLQSVRPFLLGDTVIAADTLSPLEREVLELGGVDPDTLPTLAAVTLDGRMEGEVFLRGRVEDFDVEARASARDVVYGSNSLRSADVSFTAAGLPGTEGRIQGTLTADSASWSGRTFAGGTSVVTYARPGGRATVQLRRSETEDYRASAAFEVGEGGGAVNLEQLLLRFPGARWSLEVPTGVTWDRSAVRVRDFRLVRPDADGMRIEADGVLPFEGAADFDLAIRRLSLARVASLLQTEESVGGLFDVDVHVGGTATRPTASGTVAADSLFFRNVTMARMEGEVSYEDRRLRGDLRTWRDGRLAARLEGAFPFDMGLRGVEERIPDEPIDLRAVVDSFPLVVLETLVGAMDEVRGAVSGEIHFAGTPSDVRPAGSFQVEGASFRLPGLGIRPIEVRGAVDVTERDRARVDLRGRSGGNTRIQGTVTLDPLTDPTFDLTMDADDFLAVNRRDVQGRLSGRVDLTGTYTSPVVRGSARVADGVLRIEEIERSAEVVDLSDPRFFDVVDTSLVAVEPVLEESQDPFLQNLLVEVDLQVQRSWLRSRNTNVEMAGDLVINWNRSTGDLVLTGELSAIRGNYEVSLSGLRRQFQVQEGGVEFVGTPGLDPNLDIDAIRRIRTVEGEPLTITANVTGTLSEPVVSLTSDAQPAIAESELVSYLLFGRPRFALGSGESALVQRAVGDVAGGVVLGTVATQLGTAAQEIGVDYFSVTQAPGVGTGGVGGGFGSTVAATEVEAGVYYGDLFLSLVLRPLAGVGATSVSPDRFAGVRADWQLGDVWAVQGFFEDRFSREQLSGFGDLAYRLSKIFGFFIYRDWGY